MKRVLLIVMLSALHAVLYGQDKTQIITQIMTEHYTKAYSYDRSTSLSKIFVEVNEVATAPLRDSCNCIHIEVSYSVYTKGEKDETHFKNWWIDCANNLYYYTSDFSKKNTNKNDPRPISWWTSSSGVWRSASDKKVVRKIISAYASR